MKTTRTLPFVLIATLAFIFGANPVSASFSEGWESFAIGTQQPQTAGLTNTCSAVPGDTQVVGSPVLSGGRSLRLQNIGNDCGLEFGVGLSRVSSAGTGFYLGSCDGTVGCGIGFSGFTNSGSFDGCGDASGGLNDLVLCAHIRPGMATNAFLYIDTGRTTGTWSPSAPTLATGTWYTFSAGINYTDPETGDPLTVASLTICTTTCYKASFSTANSPGTVGTGPSDMSSMRPFEGSTGSSQPVMYWDDVEIETPVGAGGQDYWCSDPTSLNFDGDPAADFGYNYAEDFLFGTPPAAIDMDDAYTAIADDADYAYLGKGWSSANSYARSIFRIEASSEGSDSYFRSVFSFEPDTPSLTSKGSGSTAGDTSGSFARHIAARFAEDGNRWRVSLQFNNDNLDDGTPGPSPNQIGQSVLWTNPNIPRAFSFTLNTAGTGYALIKDEDSNQTIINQTLSGTGIVGLQDFAGGDPFYSQWFVVGGNQVIINPLTALDDNDIHDDDGSTCIIFQEENGLGDPANIEGDPGTVPNFISDPPEGGGGGDGLDDLFPDTLSEAMLNFLGIVLMLAIGVGIYLQTHSPIMGGGGLAGGYLIGLFLGLNPLWPIVATVIIAAAVVYVRFYRGSGA